MLSKLIQFVKEHQADIILVVGVILISLLSFAMGYITAKTQAKEPLKIEMISQMLTAQKTAVAHPSGFALLEPRARSLASLEPCPLALRNVFLSGKHPTSILCELL